MKPRRNRRRPESLWTRVPRPGAIADSCGRALRRSLPALVGAGVLVAVGGSAWAGYRWVTTSPRFAITDIAVQGNRHLTADEIRAAVPVHVGDNLFATSLGRAERALRDNPWIASVELHRVLPHTVSIEIHEHVAAAVADLGGPYLVDAAGHPFKRAVDGSDEGAGLPLISGLDRDAFTADPEATAAQIRSALGALAMWSSGAGRPAITELRLDARGALSLVVAERDTAIDLGPIDGTIGARMRTFDTAWAELADSEREHARAIHLDSGTDHVTVALKDQ